MKRKQTLICPKCGSVKVEDKGKHCQCLEEDCKHYGTREPFTKGGPGTYKGFSNRHWRDGAAMSMDGIDE